MRKAFQVFLGLFGVIDIGIASLHLVLGPSAVPGSVPGNATMDSEDRFYATLFLAYGVAILYCIKDVEQKGLLVRFLALTFLVGFFARLISLAVAGPPVPFFYVMGALELLVPIGMLLVQRRLEAQRAASALQ